jgi:phage major head subunit gpT-like protein
MVITQATLDALRVKFSLQFAAAYEGTETWYEKLCTVIASDAKSNVYGWKAQSTALREWIGPRVAQNLSEHSYTLVNKKWEATVELLREEIEDENLGVFSAMTIPDLGEATRKHPDHLVSANIFTANPAAFDGKAFFAHDHPTFDGAGTYDNDLTGKDLDGDGFAAVWSAMTSLTGENGLPLKLIPDLLVVPPQLYRPALALMKSTTYAIPRTSAANSAGTTSATIDNPMQGWCDVLMVPELAADPTRWYLGVTKRAIKPFIFQTRDNPELVSRVNLNDPKVFDQDVFTYGVRARYNVGVTLPFLMFRATTN